MFLHVHLPGLLIRLKDMHLRRIHMLHHGIRLPLLEAEAETLMRIIFVVRLVLVVLHLDEIAIDRVGGQR